MRTARAGSPGPRPPAPRPRDRAIPNGRARRSGDHRPVRLLLAAFPQNTPFSRRVAAVLVNMLRLHWHILRDLLWNFAFTVVVITGVLVIAFTLDFIHRTAIFDLWIVLKIMPILLMQTMGTVVPISVLVSVISSFGRFTADGELTILKASGIHPFQVLPPALFLGVACACLTLYIHNDLVPRAD